MHISVWYSSNKGNRSSANKDIKLTWKIYLLNEAAEVAESVFLLRKFFSPPKLLSFCSHAKDHYMFQCICEIYVAEVWGSLLTLLQHKFCMCFETNNNNNNKYFCRNFYLIFNIILIFRFEKQIINITI